MFNSAILCSAPNYDPQGGGTAGGEYKGRWHHHPILMKDTCASLLGNLSPSCCCQFLSSHANQTMGFVFLMGSFPFLEVMVLSLFSCNTLWLVSLKQCFHTGLSMCCNHPLLCGWTKHMHLSPMLWWPLFMFLGRTSKGSCHTHSYISIWVDTDVYFKENASYCWRMDNLEILAVFF